MDQQLIDIIDRLSDSEGRAQIGINQGTTFGELTIGSGDAAVKYLLKPLGELYGKGPGRDNVDPQDESYMPLFLAIEGEIARCDTICRYPMMDGTVSMALSSLAMSPEAEVAPDSFAEQIQLSLRMTLSVNDYSRQDVKHAIRKILKSVDRHTKAAGQRGYLDFIHKYVKG
ncbi:MAG: hypothetical protein ABSH20_19605 [Tepidisphaeraceae bacterium]|jgi:hypothetical protein